MKSLHNSDEGAVTLRLRPTVIATGAILALCLTAFPAQATLQLAAGVDNQDTDNVLFNACSAEVLGPALTVEGCLLNGPDPDTVVRFTSNENLIADGGQATIAGADGSFDNVTITLADSSLGFSKLVFNIDVSADGTASFLAIDQFGNPFSFNNIAVDGSGENFFTLFSTDNQVATSFQIVSTVDIQLIDNLNQVRLGPTEIETGNGPGQEIPEPSSLLLAGLGLLAVSRFARPRKKS